MGKKNSAIHKSADQPDNSARSAVEEPKTPAPVIPAGGTADPPEASPKKKYGKKTALPSQEQAAPLPEAEPPLDFAVEPGPEITAEEVASPTRASRWKSSLLQKQQRADAINLAVLLLAMLDGAAMMSMGEQARRNDFERQMTDEPLQRWLQRADPEALAFITKYADPIMILAGFGMWATRLYRQSTEAREAQAKPVPGLPIVKESSQSANKNGREYIGPPAASPEAGLMSDAGALA